MKKVLLNLSKKSVSVILIMALIFSFCFNSAFAAEQYTDITNHWAENEIKEWSDYGILKGDNNSFRPNDSITRAEMATICEKVLNLQVKANNSFTDVKDGVWYTDAVLKCSAAGILKGNNGQARPNDNITREEATAMIGRALAFSESQTGAEKFTDKSSISSWALGFVNTMASKGYISGFENKFNPQSDITRAETVKIFDNIIAKYINQSGTYEGDIDGFVLIVSDQVIIKNAEINGKIIIATDDNNSSVTLDNVDTAEDIYIDSTVTLNIKGNSSIPSVNIEENAKGSIINIESGSTIQNVVSDADNVKFDGKGTIKKINVNGNDNAINTPNTDIVEGNDVSGTTVNGKPIDEESGTGGGTGGGGSSGDTELTSARKDLQTEIDNAKAIQTDDQIILYNWEALANELNNAETVIKATDKNAIKEATATLKTLITTVNNLNAKYNISKSLTLENFASEEDFNALTAANKSVIGLTSAAQTADVENIINTLAEILTKATVEEAEFTGTTVTNNWEINENGMKLVVKPTAGYNFSENIADYKDQIFDSMIFNHRQFDKANQVYNEISYDDFIVNVMKALQPPMYDEYVTDVQKYAGVYLDAEDNTVKDYVKNSAVTTLMENGVPKVDKNGNPIYLNYPGIHQEIINALKSEATVSLDKDGNLVIEVDNNGYFKTFTNQIRVTNGGVPIAQADLLTYLTIPAAAVEQGVNIKTENYYEIQEMKMHVEIWQYVEAEEALDADGELKSGYASFAGKETNASTVTGPYDETYYVKQISDNTLTEDMIRETGTMGPNDRGKYLFKLCADVRTGPTKWALDKPMTTFIGNFFRTSKDVTGYGGNNDIVYTSEDNSEWLKIENTYLNDTDYVNGNGGQKLAIRSNSYYVNFSADSRFETTDIAQMWAFIEIPTVADFNIDDDMRVYLNLIGGMFGGSGQSVSINGQPATGHDGRYYFDILATD